MVERFVDRGVLGRGDDPASERDAQRRGELACAAVGAAPQVDAVGASACSAPGCPGALPPRAPTDPDLQISRIRLVKLQVRSVRRCVAGVALVTRSV